ncbi:MAG: sulfurtransferase TusA family protein [Candidatus Flemingiibacterium sp.]
MKKVSIDCCGMQCPGPIMEVYNAVKKLDDGEQLEVTASDPGFAKDVASWCRRTGNTLISSRRGKRSSFLTATWIKCWRRLSLPTERWRWGDR